VAAALDDCTVVDTDKSREFGKMMVRSKMPPLGLPAEIAASGRPAPYQLTEPKKGKV